MNDQPDPNAPPAAGTQPPKTSGLAILSLILGLLGFLILPALAGIACGIVAMSQIKRSAGALKGHGIALAGTIVSGLMLLIFPIVAILAAMLLPALGQAKSRAQNIMGINNVRQLTLAANMYATDSQDRLPTPTKWCDLLKSYTGGSEAAYVRPDDRARGVRCSYGYNARLAGMKTGEVNKNTVLVFELQAGAWNISGGPELMRRPTSSRDRVVVGFADGRAEALGADRLGSLRWDP